MSDNKPASKYAAKRRKSLEATHGGHTVPVSGCTLCGATQETQDQERVRLAALPPPWAPPPKREDDDDGG